LEVTRLKLKFSTTRAGCDRDRDLVVVEVLDEFADTGEGLNCGPEEVLGNVTLCEVGIEGERDPGEEGEEVGSCLSFGFKIKMRKNCARWTTGTYASPSAQP
jgi:hypothetical protein